MFIFNLFTSANPTVPPFGPYHYKPKLPYEVEMGISPISDDNTKVNGNTTDVENKVDSETNVDNGNLDVYNNAGIGVENQIESEYSVSNLDRACF